MDLVVMCIGNRDGGDDAVGPYVADVLKEKKIGFEVVDCGTTPENFTSIVKRLKPKKVVIIDAVEMGLPPGSIRVIPMEKIGVMHISTHGIPVSVLIQYLNKFVEKVVLVGVQPKNMSGCMSDKVKNTADKLIKLIMEDKLKEIKYFE